MDPGFSVFFKAISGLIVESSFDLRRHRKGRAHKTELHSPSGFSSSTYVLFPAESLHGSGRSPDKSRSTTFYTIVARCGSSELKTPVSQGVLIPASRTLSRVWGWRAGERY